MRSAKSSINSFLKIIGMHSINALDAFGTGICSVAAFTCLVVLDGWLLKLSGVIACLLLICLIIYLSDRLKERVK